MIEFPSEEITGIDEEYKHDVYDTPNVHMLRKDREEEIKNKDKELKLNNNAIKLNKKKDESDKVNKYINPSVIDNDMIRINGKVISNEDFDPCKKTVLDIYEEILIP